MTIGAQRHLVTVQSRQPAPVPDGDGDYAAPVYADAVPPTWYCAIVPATAHELERFGVGALLAAATHLVRGHYRADITTYSRLVFAGRLLTIASLINVDERSRELVLVCQELTA